MDPRHTRATALCTAALSLLGLLIAASVGAADADTTEVDDEQADSAIEEEAIEVPVLVEAAEIEVQPGHVRFDSESISRMPGGEANLADLLRVNPAVDFSRDAELSGSTAVQRPAEISIHGQPFYQNAFLIDGIDTANDLNPADVEDVWDAPGPWQIQGGSSPQGYYIDTGLVESVEVYDSNVPAEYGGFTGGVVAAELKDYDGEDTVSIAYSLRRDEWEEFHVTEDDVGINDYRTAAYTPDYRRSSLVLGVQRGIGDLGLSLSVSRRHSTFAQRYDKFYHFARRETQYLDYDDVIDNIVGKVDGNLGATAVGVSFRHARRRHDGLTSTTYDGRFDKSHDGNGLTIDIETAVALGRLEVTIGLDRLRDIIDSEDNRYVYHESAEGSATDAQFEGSYGDTEQSQTRMTVKPKLTFAPRTVGGVEHRIVLGGELQRTDSYYERPEEVVAELYWCVRDQGREGCQDQNGDGVSGPEDEYLRDLQIFTAASVELTYGSAALYAEDRMAIGQWQLNLGMRVDWNDYLGNVDLSPRFSVERDVFGDDRTVVVGGLNRYYGRSFFRYKLNDAISAWRERTQFNSNGSVRREFVYVDRSGDLDLSTPYSDEWMLGLTQALGKASVGLQFVNRESRDGVNRARFCLDPDDARCREFNYTYVNEGRSSTQSVGLRLSSAESLRLGPTETTFAVSLGYKDATRQGTDTYDEEIDPDLIYYNGDLIREADLPPWDYNVPFSTSFYTVTSFARWNLTWSNFAKLRRGGTIARDSGADCDDDDIDYCEGSYNIYEDFDFDSHWTFDARVEWRPDLIADSRGFVRLEIKNLLDDVVDTNSLRLSDRRRFTSGRLFWVELGLDI
ncbi:MAG: TonB-dependent receptor plug domain-containing protein [Gammaproteobacteria bacterium]|nr:TonB-dependent receptor plug domain-containing protein [Gammaproteobacteria bacterium]